MKSEKCEDCSGELGFFLEGKIQGFRCKTCGYGAVTSYFSPVELDREIYKVLFVKSDFRNHQHIQLVSKIMNVSFLAARDVLSGKNREIFSGPAVEVLRVAERLMGAGVAYEITPDFTHQLPESRMKD